MSAIGEKGPWPRPAREVAARRDTGRLAANLERLAELLAESAAVVRDLARDLPDALDDLAGQRLMDGMPNAESTQSSTAWPELLTAEDLARGLRVSVKTVRRWRSEGRLPEPIEIAGVLRWRRVDVNRWLAGEGSR